MRLKLKNTTRNGDVLVAWDSVEVQKEDGQPFDGIIKEISLSIKAGDIAVLSIEEYVLDSSGNVVVTAAEAKSSFKNQAVTKKTNYPISSFTIETGETLLPPVQAKNIRKEG